MSRQSIIRSVEDYGKNEQGQESCGIIDLSPFKELIKKNCGLSFDEARAETLRTGILTRMSALGLASGVHYLDLLARAGDEFDKLVSLLTINETYFFREHGHLQLLTDHLVPGLLASKKANENIRIMSAGCSTGEEPYSIVMTLMEKYGDSARRLFTVLGVDIDSDAVKSARQGCYSGHSFRNFPEHLKGKYFDSPRPNVFRVKDIVSDQVEFCLLNLLSETYPDRLQGLDVIFYRNVSIYFEPEVQKSIFLNLSHLLKEDGYLIVSSTETLGHNIGVLSLVEIDNQFLYQKKVGVEIGNRRRESGHSSRPEPTARSLPFSKKPARPTFPRQGGTEPNSAGASQNTDTHERRGRGELFDEALSLARAKNYRDALNRIDEMIVQDTSFSKAYSLKASVLINLKQLDEAEQTCLICIGKEPWCLEAFLLLGMIAKIRDDDETAFKRFKEALYIQSSCWLAHFHIAEIHRLRGETNRAYREYEIVINLLKKGNAEDHGLTFFPLAFPIDQIVHLCNHNLVQLKRRMK